MIPGWWDVLFANYEPTVYSDPPLLLSFKDNCAKCRAGAITPLLTKADNEITFYYNTVYLKATKTCESNMKGHWIFPPVAAVENGLWTSKHRRGVAATDLRGDAKVDRSWVINSAGPFYGRKSYERSLLLLKKPVDMLFLHLLPPLVAWEKICIKMADGSGTDIFLKGSAEISENSI